MDELTFFAKLDEYALTVVDATKVVYGVSSAISPNEFEARAKVAAAREALWRAISADTRNVRGERL